MMVKICGITNAEDAAMAVAAGATALGFNFYPPSPRAISPAAAASVRRTLPDGILTAGVFVDTATAEVAAIMTEAGLDIAQIIGPAPSGVRWWRVHRMNSEFSASLLEEDGPDAFLLDSSSATLHGGTGQTFDWRRAQANGKRIILAGGLGPDNVAEAIRIARPWGVDACSRLEISPGRKDPAKVHAFVTAALNV